jgi:hypothetical protein
MSAGPTLLSGVVVRHLHETEAAWATCLAVADLRRFSRPSATANGVSGAHRPSQIAPLSWAVHTPL